MDFKTLHELIPYAKNGKEKFLRASPYNGITIAMPGRHALDTTPVGGDFVVMVDDEEKNWLNHQFTHVDLFKDAEVRNLSSNPVDSRLFLPAYLDIVTGGDPDNYKFKRGIGGVVHPQTLMYAVQCLAVAEHRRYHQYEAKFGGRYLPFRFVAGIVEGLWTAADAAGMQRRGRPGVEQLERTKGVPELTKELINA